MEPFQFGYLTLDGYVEGDHESKQLSNTKELRIQYFQEEHASEYVVAEYENGVMNGEAKLFNHTVLSLKWICEQGKRIGNFTVYRNGIAWRDGNWLNLFDKYDDICFIENCTFGKEMVLIDRQSGIPVYRGNYSPQSHKKEGLGCEYSPHTGKPIHFGWYVDDVLRELFQEFSEDGMMYEYKNNQAVYVGEYKYNPHSGRFVRDGKGNEIDPSSHLAVWSGAWEMGKKGEGVALDDRGYYKVNAPAQEENEEAVVGEMDAFRTLPPKTKSLVFDASFGSDEELPSVDLSPLEYLQHVSLEDGALASCPGLTVSSLKFLTCLTLGSDCLATASSCVLSDLPELTRLRLGDRCLRCHQTVELANLPALKELTFGDNACRGDEENYAVSLSKLLEYLNVLVMRNLPRLERLEFGRQCCGLVGKVVLERIPITPDRVHYSGSRQFERVTYMTGDSKKLLSPCCRTKKRRWLCL